MPLEAEKKLIRRRVSFVGCLVFEMGTDCVTFHSLFIQISIFTFFSTNACVPRVISSMTDAAPGVRQGSGPSPLIVYEPAKRIFIGGLPHDTTKEELIDFVRKRSRANPRNVELSAPKGSAYFAERIRVAMLGGAVEQEEGDLSTPAACATNCRGFAHMSVEGMKGVIEALNGLPLRGQRITVAPAKTHFAYALMSAKVAKESAAHHLAKAAEDAAAMEAAATEAVQQHAGGNGDAVEPAHDSNVENGEPLEGETITATTTAARSSIIPPPPFHFFDCRRRFAGIAREVALKFRPAGDTRRAAASTIPASVGEKRPRDGGAPQTRVSDKAQARSGLSSHRGGRGGGQAAPSRPTRVAPPPPPPPPPPKDERKTNSLRAKLELLRARIAAA